MEKCGSCGASISDKDRQAGKCSSCGAGLGPTQAQAGNEEEEETQG